MGRVNYAVERAKEAEYTAAFLIRCFTQTSESDNEFILSRRGRVQTDFDIWHLSQTGV